MSFMRKTKEFFGLDNEAVEYEDDAYYNDAAYDAPAAYGAEREYGRYGAYERRETRASYPSSIVNIAAHSYSDAKRVGESFRDGDAIVLDLRDLPRDEAKRFVDFSAGLVMAVDGDLWKLENMVFGLRPPQAHDLHQDDLRRSVRMH